MAGSTTATSISGSGVPQQTIVRPLGSSRARPARSASTETRAAVAVSEVVIMRVASAIPQPGRWTSARKPWLRKRSVKRSRLSQRIGSPPLGAFSHDDSSSVLRSSSETLRTQRSRAKFGKAEVVPRWRVIARSQRYGRFRKSSGERRTVRDPDQTGWRTPPTRPMSWYEGSHETKTESGVNRPMRAISRELWRRFAWVTITPRGEAVEPEVYWRKATPSRSGRGGLQSADRSGSRLSVAIQGTAPSCGPWARSPSRIEWTSAVVRTSRGRASATIPASRGIVRPSRDGSGG